ncbi:MAG TPA: ADP-forming succinate--CoA ligase subunit beta [Actinomycetota bacterium]|jgi:succinyl-CoA synthetase beta subunit|nr:ADP-forming succinate--CoA ligase subunit beta [Actinomycetota bacterium]
MDLLEYMGKQVFARFDIPVSDGRICTTAAEAETAAKEIGGQVVVKAQVQIGGRGKAGGIQLADSPAEAKAKAEQILGMDIRGHIVERVWVEASTDIAKEYYASITLDRRNGLPLAMVSAQGGVDIEEVASKDPKAIKKMHIDPLVGFKPFHAAFLTSSLDEEAREGSSEILRKLFTCFVDGDCSLVEINPLVLTTDGRVHALDAKVTVDDNAIFRHPEYAEYRDILVTDPQEKLAKEKGIAYVKLDGEVGVMGNGAGLVMSTLDLVNLAGGKPANFLDVGGGASADQIAAALEIILGDPQVRSVLVNIFGGITRCDEVAKGIIGALDRVELKVPMVVRLDGTNAAEGREILNKAKLDGVESAPAMWEAAELAVERARA